MGPHLTRKSRLTIHLVPAAVLVTCAIVGAHSPTLWRTVASVAGTTLAAHAGIAMAAHVGLALAGLEAGQ